MATIGSLIVAISGSTSGLRKALDQANDMVEATRSRFAGLGAAIQTGLGGAAAAGIVALGGVAVAATNMAGQMRSATGDLVAGLGVAQDEALALREAAVQVYQFDRSGLVDDLGEATAGIIEVRRQMELLTNNELAQATQQSLNFASRFDENLSEVAGSANVLMKDFQLSATQAFDALTFGAQSGLNNSKDLLTTISEYGPALAATGFSAQQMFSIFAAGQSGPLGIDRITDLTMEFGRRMREEADAVRPLLAGMGLDYDQIAASVARGESTFADYFDRIVVGINAIADPTARAQAQILAFGDAAGDLGPDFTRSLSSTLTTLDDMAGATDSLTAKYENFGQMFEVLKRQALVAIAPIGEKFLELGSRFMPQVLAAMDQLAASIPVMLAVILPALDNFSNYIFSTVLPTLQVWGAWFINQGVPAIRAFLVPIIGALLPGLQQLAAWVGQIATTVLPLLGQAFQFVADNAALIGPIVAVVGAAIVALTGPVSLIAVALVGLATAWANNWGNIQGITASVMAWITANVWPVIQAGITWITDTALPTLAAIWRVTWQAIQTTVQNVLPIIGAVQSAFLVASEGDWQAFGVNLRRAWDQAWALIQQGLSSAGAFLLQAMINLANSLWQAVANINWFEVGANVIWGIVAGVSATMGALTRAVENAAQAALEAAQGFLGISSPSTVFQTQVGHQMVEGLITGLEAGQGQVAESVNSWVDVGSTLPTINVPDMARPQPELEFPDLGQAQVNVTGPDLRPQLGGGGDNITINLALHLDGQTEPEKTRQAARGGVLEALRAAGLR